MERFGVRRFTFLLLVCAALAMFLELGRMDIVSDNEGQRATPPAEMLRSGNFIIPTINGIDYLAKPPLLYWAIASVYKATGVISPLTARIPSALCACALVTAVYLLFRRRAGEAPARWAAVALLASPYFLERARWAQLDIPLTLMTFLAIMAFRFSLDTQSPGKRLLTVVCGSVSLGAAIMLKGPAPLLFLWAAWTATELTTGHVNRRTLITSAKLILPALALEVILKLTGVFSFPFALVTAALFWTWAAWRCGNAERGKRLATVLLMLCLAVALIAPWGIAVLKTQGWSYVSSLLDYQVMERTHTATRINAGLPVFYVSALPLLLAPWGFLLPLHLLPAYWREKGQSYRFALTCGWLSVLIFSLVAGKEHEYLFPAYPFLLLVTGFHVADFAAGRATGLGEKWSRYWVKAMMIILTVAAVGQAIYVTIELARPLLLAEVWLCAALVVFFAIRKPLDKPSCIFVMALAVIVTGMIAFRSYHYTGDRSPKEIAEASGRLIRDGYKVEASWLRPPPAFIFYAAAVIPSEPNLEAVRSGLSGETPYFYIAREKELEKYAAELEGVELRRLIGPCTSKRFVLLGNRSLPESASTE